MLTRVNALVKRVPWESFSWYRKHSKTYKKRVQRTKTIIIASVSTVVVCGIAVGVWYLV